MIQHLIQPIMIILFKDLNMHMIKHLSINVTEREVFVINNYNGYSKKVKILTKKWLFLSETYKLDEETVEKLKNIVIKRKIKLDRKEQD